MDQTLVFDLNLIKRYDKSGPRYTSYPTAVQFHDGFGDTEYRRWADRTSAREGHAPLSLYFHIPFCDTVCYYCACNKVVTKDRTRAARYLERLHKEIEIQGALFDDRRPVEQLHWGGGTPTFISHEQMRDLMRVTGEHFTLCSDDSGEYSVEVDPREADRDTIALLREIGFTRLSLGVQDFDPRVQKAVNRIQSEAETWAVLDAARAEGFKSVSIDLIYGLPHQNQARWSETLDKVIEHQPDRLSVFNYAHLPDLFKPQRRINAEELPLPAEKLDILQLTGERLVKAGYVYIGMDHFARPDDELAVAQRGGTLYRNFQGYSTHADCDLIGLGATAISQVGDSYAQNVREVEEYYDCLDQGRLPVFRGLELTADDKLRRAVITELICHFHLEFSHVETDFGIDFRDYFQGELEDCLQLERDGLVALSADGIQVQPAGRLLIRNVCMVFDRYLREGQERRFSKVI